MMRCRNVQPQTPRSPNRGQRAAPIHRRRCYSSKSKRAAVVIFSNCLLFWAHHSVSAFSPTSRVRAIGERISVRSAAAPHPPLKASGTARYQSDGNNNRKKISFSERHQLRQRQWWLSGYMSPHLMRRKNNSNAGQKHQRNKRSEDQVHEWLLKSTSRILGHELTLKLVNGGDDTGFTPRGRTSSDCKQKLPSDFSTTKKFIFNSESVMRAWCRWISRCSNDEGLHISFDDDADDAIRCTAINAAKIVDAVLNRVLVIDEQRAFEEGEEGNMGAEEWEIKMVELVNLAIDIDAWRNEKTSDQAVSHAEEWLHFLQQRLEGSVYLSERVMKLYEESYRGVIKACIRSRERKYLERAISLLGDLRLQQYLPRTTSQIRLYPATQTYNLVLYGLANCEPCLESAKIAENLLQEMIDCDQKGGKYSCSPDSNTFRQVITAWAKSNANVEAAENAQRILDKMISDFPMLDPDASAFNALMALYLKLGKPKEALSLFDLITSMHESGRSDTQPDSYSVNLMLKAMTKNYTVHLLEDMEVIEEVLKNTAQPDKQSYNIVIDAWGKSNLREAAIRAEMLLDCMEMNCRHDPNIAPDSYSFTSTINAIERSRHQARGSWAEKVFNRMKELHSQGLVEEPTTPVYNALMNTLISSGESGSIERAEALFSEMRIANITNTRTFNTLLKGYGMFERSRKDGRIISSSRPRKAEQLLDQMEFSYFSGGKTSVIRPDKYSYTTVISAYGRSNVKRKAAKSYEILHRMIDSFLEGNLAAKPGTFAFNAVLNACAHTRLPGERLEGFTILCSTLILLRDWAKPDHTTYGTFLQASSNLLPRDEAQKLRVVEAVFNSCVKEGQCGQMVVKNLKNVASPELYDALVGRFLTDDGLDIPLKWRRNVAGQDGFLATSFFDSE